MSLSREIAEHALDAIWVRTAFGGLLVNITKVPTMRNRRSLDNWFRKNIGRPLHKGGMNTDTLKNLKQTFRHLASEILRASQEPHTEDTTCVTKMAV